MAQGVDAWPDWIQPFKRQGLNEGTAPLLPSGAEADTHTAGILHHQHTHSGQTGST